MKDSLITIAIRSLEQAKKLAEKLELSGIKTLLSEVDEQHETIGVGMRVRVDENDMQRALKVIESADNQNDKPQNNNPEHRHILVPIDFSDYSLRAAKMAFSIAHTLGNCSVMLLHAYIFPKSFVTMAGHRAVMSPDKDVLRHFMTTLEGDMKNLSQKIRQQIANTKLASVKFDLTTVDGIPEEVIIDYCEKNAPLLVVMGTRGKDKKAEDLIGSVTAEVIEHATVPVLAIPEDSDLQLPENEPIKIMLATNFDDRMLISFRRMMDLLNGLNFNLLIAHFDDNPDDWDEIKLAGLKDFCYQNYPNLQTECIIVAKGDQDTLDVFDRLVAEHHIDAIALNTHKRRLFASLFNPSIARKMVFHAHTPILVFHS